MYEFITCKISVKTKTSQCADTRVKYQEKIYCSVKIDIEVLILNLCSQNM